MTNYDEEEQFDWRVGPCAGMTWAEWCDIQAEMSGMPTLKQLMENEADEDNEADEADDSDVEEIEVPQKPRTVLRSEKRVSFGTIAKDRSIHHNAIEIPITPTKSTERVVQCPCAPKKAKTRAERRAADPESDSCDSDFVTPKKKERRTDYWAFQDDLRIKRAKRERALSNSEDFSSGGTYQFEPVSFGEGWCLAEELLLST
jgi:hypothetical protein